MSLAARIDSVTSPPHNGTLTGGVTTVLIGGIAAAVANDPGTMHQCHITSNPPHKPSMIVQGSGTVFFAGKAAARVGDTTECGATIMSGAFDVLIGG